MGSRWFSLLESSLRRNWQCWGQSARCLMVPRARLKTVIGTREKGKGLEAGAASAVSHEVQSPRRQPDELAVSSLPTKPTE